MPVLGICNGFQVLCEAGLLPGALTRNSHLHFRNRDQVLRVERADTAWTQRLRRPASGSSSRSRTARAATSPPTPTSTGSRARAGSCSATSTATRTARAADIAGVTSENGRVVGLMPHPEHAVEDLTGPSTDGLGFFTSVLKAVVERMSIDTVERAEKTPDDEQPWAELGLKSDEYLRIRDILGRRPTTAELAMYSVMWSEHCSYKSSKVHLRQFGDLPHSEALLVGIGENAGVVDVGDGYAVTFKVESHNHPSYVEPYQGAATGVGGIVRDILTMGARPIAVMDSLRFGRADAPDTARVLPGVVAGVGGYGNCLGLPNIGGELLFDDCYAGNPLVNALCVGVMKHEDVRLAKAEGLGNKVILFGARTGGDGIGGVSVLACETFDEHGPAKRPSVQVGDPFTEKLLIEACLEIFAADLVTGIQDLGGAGLSCATSELASAGTGGMHVDLDTVPLRDSTLTPAEILMSESQERMCAIVEPAKVDAFLAVCRKWDVLATVIGEVTDGDRLTVDWHGERIVDVPPRTVAHEGPVYDRPMRRPADLDDLQADDAAQPARGRRPAPSCRPTGSPSSPARTAPTRPGSPSSTTATSAATRCSPSPRTPASSASTRRPTAASRWPSTATPATPGSTRTPARS